MYFGIRFAIVATMLCDWVLLCCVAGCIIKMHVLYTHAQTQYIY